MGSIIFYKDSYYKEVKQILQECGLYDDAWEARINLKRKIERDPESILIAKEGDKIIGCVLVVEDGWNAFIFRLCVKESYRKKGVGSILMRRAEEIVKKRGLKEVSILVDPKKDSLKNWYQKQGYLNGSDWTFMYKKLQ